MPQHMGELPYTIPVMDEKSGEIRQVGSVWSIQTLLHSLYNSRAWSDGVVIGGLTCEHCVCEKSLPECNMDKIAKSSSFRLASSRHEPPDVSHCYYTVAFLGPGWIKLPSCSNCKRHQTQCDMAGTVIKLKTPLTEKLWNEVLIGTTSITRLSGQPFKVTFPHNRGGIMAGSEHRIRGNNCSYLARTYKRFGAQTKGPTSSLDPAACINIGSAGFVKAAEQYETTLRAASHDSACTISNTTALDRISAGSSCRTFSESTAVSDSRTDLACEKSLREKLEQALKEERTTSDDARRTLQETRSELDRARSDVQVIQTTRANERESLRQVEEKLEALMAVSTEERARAAKESARAGECQKRTKVLEKELKLLEEELAREKRTSADRLARLKHHEARMEENPTSLETTEMRSKSDKLKKQLDMESAANKAILATLRQTEKHLNTLQIAEEVLREDNKRLRSEIKLLENSGVSAHVKLAHSITVNDEISALRRLLAYERSAIRPIQVRANGANDVSATTGEDELGAYTRSFDVKGGKRKRHALEKAALRQECLEMEQERDRHLEDNERYCEQLDVCRKERDDCQKRLDRIRRGRDRLHSFYDGVVETFKE